MQKDYILQTPVMNEEKDLPKLINSILEQSIKPSVWLIIDDGSTDSTPDIIKNAQRKYSWIYSIVLNKSKRDLGLHLSEVINIGIKSLIEICEEKKIEYAFWGNIDADITLENNYYQRLINEFNEDPKLGIASGGTWYHKGNEIRHYNTNINEPSGGNMLIRKECLIDCGLGVPKTYSWDSIIKTKARIYGWKTRRFENIKSIESRDVNAVAGYWKGSFDNGKGSYFINMHPIHIFLKSIKISRKSPYYLGVAYTLGYLYSLILIRTKIADEDIKNYNWKKWRILINESLK